MGKVMLLERCKNHMAMTSTTPRGEQVNLYLMNMYDPQGEHFRKFDDILKSMQKPNQPPPNYVLPLLAPLQG